MPNSARERPPGHNASSTRRALTASSTKVEDASAQKESNRLTEGAELLEERRGDGGLAFRKRHYFQGFLSILRERASKMPSEE